MSEHRTAERGKVIGRGELPCQKCGRIHDCYSTTVLEKTGAIRPGRTWSDPGDGHDYWPLSWEAIGRLAIDRYKIDLEELARA